LRENLIGQVGCSGRYDYRHTNYPLSCRNTQDEVYVLCMKEQGNLILKNNPFVTKIIEHEKDAVPNDKLGEYFESVRQAYECDRYIDMCESLEVAIALHPNDPMYNLTKNERKERCDKNYYDYSFEFAKLPETKGTRGEIYFDATEEEWAKKFYAGQLKDKFVLLWGLSGSGRNKAYPFAEYVMADLVKKYTKLQIITVGDDVCRLLESLTHPQITHMSGYGHSGRV